MKCRDEGTEGNIEDKRVREKEGGGRRKYRRRSRSRKNKRAKLITGNCGRRVGEM